MRLCLHAIHKHPSIYPRMQSALRRLQPAGRSFYTVNSTRRTMVSTTEALRADKLFDLSGWVTLVSGGGTGIGLMCAQALAANKAKVYIASVSGVFFISSCLLSISLAVATKTYSIV